MTTETPKKPKLSREERLAQNLRDNLRRRKQVVRKRKESDTAEPESKS